MCEEGCMNKAFVAITYSMVALSIACAPTKQAKVPESQDMDILASSENIRTYNADYETTFRAALDTLRRIEESGSKFVKHSEGLIIFKKPNDTGMIKVNVERVGERATRVDISVKGHRKNRMGGVDRDTQDAFFEELGELLASAEAGEIVPGAKESGESTGEKSAAPDVPERETIESNIQQALRLKKDENFLDALSYEELVLLDRRLEVLASDSAEKDKLSQRCVACYIDLARFYHDDMIYDRSAEALKIAISIDPDSAIAHCNLGEIYKHLELYDEAIRELQEAERLDPDLPDTFINFGIIYDDYLVDDKKALEYYRKYLELGGSDEQVQKWMAEIERSP
jgi:tetratricopeptide (TPR) repeat protein